MFTSKSLRPTCRIHDLQWMLKWNYLFIIFRLTLIALTCFIDALSDSFKSIFFYRFCIFDSWCWSLTVRLNSRNKLAQQNPKQDFLQIEFPSFVQIIMILKMLTYQYQLKILQEYFHLKYRRKKITPSVNSNMTASMASFIHRMSYHICSLLLYEILNLSTTTTKKCVMTFVWVTCEYWHINGNNFRLSIFEMTINYIYNIYVRVYREHWTLNIRIWSNIT